MNQMYRNQNMPYQRMNQGCMKNNDMQTPCSCSQNNTMENMSQAQLLKHITEVSFAVVDSTLYLDTHPHDCDALDYNKEMVAMRNAALEVYAKRFGPLTIDCTTNVNSNSWEWILQPWPWEGASKGGCR